MNKGYKRADIESATTGICVLMRIIGKIIIPNSAFRIEPYVTKIKRRIYAVFTYIKRGYAGAWDRAV